MFAILNSSLIICSNKKFRSKIINKRKQSLGNLGKFVKSEVQETRTIFQDHVKYIRKNKNTDKNTNKNTKKNTKKINDNDIEVLDAEFFEK